MTSDDGLEVVVIVLSCVDAFLLFAIVISCCYCHFKRREYWKLYHQNIQEDTVYEKKGASGGDHQGYYRGGMAVGGGRYGIDVPTGAYFSTDGQPVRQAQFVLEPKYRT